MPVILFEKKDHIAIITRNRPEAMNAMSSEMRDEEAKAWERVREEDDIWVAIITGTGRAFSAGADLKERTVRMERAPALPSQPSESVIWKPIIAAINGYAMGGGFEMAMACDIRIASETAVFGLPEVTLPGLPPSGSVRLPRLIPLGMALELLFTGDRISAQEAYRLGLVNRVVPPDQLMPTAEALARKICENSPVAVRVAKITALRTLGMQLSDGMALSTFLGSINRLSDDWSEATKARTEKRKPEFRGR